MKTPNKLENELKPDWKEWIPIYGVKQVVDDISNKKFIPPERYGRFVGLIIYQSITTSAGIMGTASGIYHISELIKKIFE